MLSAALLTIATDVRAVVLVGGVAGIVVVVAVVAEVVVDSVVLAKLVVVAVDSASSGATRRGSSAFSRCTEATMVIDDTPCW